jgi:hypothetical protein
VVGWIFTPTMDEPDARSDAAWGAQGRCGKDDAEPTAYTDAVTMSGNSTKPFGKELAGGS